MLGLGLHLILHFIILFACVIDTQAHSGVFLLMCCVISKDGDAGHEGMLANI